MNCNIVLDNNITGLLLVLMVLVFFGWCFWFLGKDT